MSAATLSLPRIKTPALKRPELGALLVLAGVLNLWALSRNGWANTYYSGAVKSMASSWHAFLYGSFDASGVMTVDKPPLALWVQALSARIFGVNSWSMLAPQALMGMATVALTYDLVRRRFGRPAGFAAGLVLALTPITVAISRHNNPDALLVLCCAAALWFAVRALEHGRTKWLVWAGVMVGLGFEAKMAVALMVVPGIVVAWLWVHRRLKPLLLGGVAMVAVGGAWPLLVALTPASDRPWISGTADNSIWSLIWNYNGFGRLDGQGGGPGGGAGGPGGGGGGGFFGGSPGVGRLLNQALGGQAGWFLDIALVAGLALLVVTRLKRTDARTGWLLAVGGAALTTAVAFSRAKGIFHPYYVSLLAPFVAALVGAGVPLALRTRIVGPVALAAGLACELKVLHDNDSLSGPQPLILIGVAAAAAALAVVDRKDLRRVALATGLAALLIAPGAWAFDTLGHATSGTFPAGGPATMGFGGPGGGGPGGGGGGPFGAGGNLEPALAYAKAHGGGTVAISGQAGAGDAVTRGENVVAIGGFSGRESQVTAQWLAQAIRQGKIRYVLTDSGGFGMANDPRVGSRDVMSVVQKTCTKVSSVSGLYDCAGYAAQIAAASG